MTEVTVVTKVTVVTNPDGDILFVLTDATPANLAELVEGGYEYETTQAFSYDEFVDACTL